MELSLELGLSLQSAAARLERRAWSNDKRSRWEMGTRARPLSALASGLGGFSGANWRNAAFNPVDIWRGETDRPLESMEAFRGKRKVRKETGFNGREALRPCLDRPGAAVRLQGELSKFGVDVCGAKVSQAARAGFGAGRGFRYLSSGFIVIDSELVELTLAFRRLWSPLLNCMGTSRTLTGCPGSIGHAVVDGSAGLWKSTSWSN